MWAHVGAHVIWGAFIVRDDQNVSIIIYHIIFLISHVDHSQVPISPFIICGAARMEANNPATGKPLQKSLQAEADDKLRRGGNWYLF